MAAVASITGNLWRRERLVGAARAVLAWDTLSKAAQQADGPAADRDVFRRPDIFFRTSRRTPDACGREQDAQRHRVRPSNCREVSLVLAGFDGYYYLYHFREGRTHVLLTNSLAI